MKVFHKSRDWRKKLIKKMCKHFQVQASLIICERVELAEACENNFHLISRK